MDKFNLSKLKHLFDGEPHDLLMTLQRWGLIPIEGQYLCPRCSAPLRLHRHAPRPEAWFWQCRNVISLNNNLKPCNIVVTFRMDTFLDKLRSDLYKSLGFVNLWVYNASIELLQCQLEITSQMAIEWSSVCRGVLLDAFVSNPKKLGGPGAVLEVGESIFRNPNGEGDQRAFGGFERGTGRVFMVPVENIEPTTLIPVIKTWIEEGTTVISHPGEAYRGLQEEGYSHFTVGQALNSEEPIVYGDINSMTSSWCAAKASMSSDEFSKSNISGDLARYMFYKHCDHLQEDRTTAFYALAGKMYDPRNPRLFEENTDIKVSELFGNKPCVWTIKLNV